MDLFELGKELAVTQAKVLKQKEEEHPVVYGEWVHCNRCTVRVFISGTEITLYLYDRDQWVCEDCDDYLASLAFPVEDPEQFDLQMEHK